MHHLPSRYIPCDGRLTASAYFKFTLPAWGATRAADGIPESSAISIHAPRMGSDEMDPGLVSGIYISIHAPRGGNDTPLRVHGRIQQYFNPRSPHGERQYSQSIQQ